MLRRHVQRDEAEAAARTRKMSPAERLKFETQMSRLSGPKNPSFTHFTEADEAAEDTAPRPWCLALGVTLDPLGCNLKLNG